MSQTPDSIRENIPIAPQRPVVGIFPDRRSAEDANRKLRQAGFPGEDIGWIETDFPPSVANAAGSYRATGEQAEAATFAEPARTAKVPATGRRRSFLRIALTVQADADRRSQAEEIIRNCGGTLQARVAPLGLTDHASEMPEGNPRAA